MASKPSMADPIARRLRARRAALGLSLGQASARAGLKAPSFLYHIERGERLPSEQVVVWLAAALQDDEELLRAWVRLRRGAPLDLALAAARLLERHLAASGESSLALSTSGEAPSHDGGEESANGDSPSDGASRADGAASDGASEISLLVRVPRFEWGADPTESPSSIEVLRLDPHMLPKDSWLRPFAYRLPAGVSQPAPFQAGDLVILTRNAWPLHPKSTYLVRTVEGPRLSRVAWRNGTLWLAAEHLGQAQPLRPSGTPPRDLLGRVGAMIRMGAASPEA